VIFIESVLSDFEFTDTFPKPPLQLHLILRGYGLRLALIDSDQEFIVTPLMPQDGLHFALDVAPDFPDVL